MKKHKDIFEAQFIRDLKTVFPDISEEDIKWHVNLSRQPVVEKTMMNERIKELAMQSGFRNYNGHNLFSPIEGMELDDELEEFAKLIIKECVDIMREQSYNTSMLLSHPPKSSAVWDACNAIEKKFGVK
jgi:hypothetical protein